MDYNDKVKVWCIKNANYRIYKTLAGISSFSSLMHFSFAQRGKEIADNATKRNLLAMKLGEREFKIEILS